MVHGVKEKLWFSMASQSGSTSATGRSSRGSIHTPLSPANVQDLKAKFDQGKTGNGTTTTSIQRNRVQADSSRKELVKSSSGMGAEFTFSTSKSLTCNTLSSVNSSLQAAVQRQLGSSTCSISSTSPVVSSSLRSTGKSSAAASARPYSPSSLSSYSKSGSVSSSGRSSPCMDSNSKVTTSLALSSVSTNYEPKSSTRPATTSAASTISAISSTSISLSTSELRNSSDRNLGSSLVLPVGQISTTGSEVTIQTTTLSTSVSKNPQTDIGSSYINKKTPGGKSALDSVSSSVTRPQSQIDKSLSKYSPPTERCNKLVAREVKLQQPDSRASATSSATSVKSYRDSITSKRVNTTSATKTTNATSAAKTTNTTSAAKTTNTTSATKITNTTSTTKTTNTTSIITTATTTKTSNTTTATKIANTITTPKAASTITINKTENIPSFISATKTPNTITTTKTSNTTTATAAAATTTGTKTIENVSLRAKVGKVTTGSSSHRTNTVAEPEFSQVKLRKTRSEQPGVTSHPSSLRSNLKGANSVEEKRISCKINSERFERLMFDFQRGVPSEAIVRRGSETDHIVLQQKARELPKSVLEDDAPVIGKSKKEPSILTEGLKVSDFVKQVNKLNPETEVVPKWKVQRAHSQTSSAASSDVGGDNFYQGIPGDDPAAFSDDNDDIYEKVTHRVSSPDGKRDGKLNKSPGQRLGVYRQMKNITNNALKKLKQRGSKKKLEKTRPSSSKAVKDCEKTSHSDGSVCENGDWSSSGTEYEDMSPDGNVFTAEGEVCLYEELKDLSKQTSQTAKNKTITHKLKKIFYKSGAKNKKSKSLRDSLGLSGGTESEADTVDDMEETDNDLTENFSRTSSERSSGRLTRDNTTVNLINSSSLNTDETSIIGNPVSSLHPAPRLPSRATKVLSQPLENSPPLPPRNVSTSNKATLENSQDLPMSPTDKVSADSQVDKTRNVFPFGDNIHDGGETETVSAPGKIEYNELDPASAVTLDKLERSDSTSKKKRSLFGRKPGGSSQPVKAATSSSSYTYPDITAFPELRGYDVNLYVDLEDAQIYGRTSDFYVSKFESQPLYQWYSKDKVIQNMCSDKSTSDDLSSDDEYLEESRRPESLYEDVEKLVEKAISSCPKAVTTSGSKQIVDPDMTITKDKPERRSVIDEVFKRGSSLHRALWCQMPEVIESGILDKLTDSEKKIQEAMFEIITSEASYLKSLNILISVFLMAPEFSADMSDQCVISRRDRQILFSNIGHIKDISEEFLKDLENRWQESCYIKDICDIIHKHARHKFEPYVHYCGNQAFQDRAINVLRLNTDFTDAVRKLEQNPDCQSLPLASFLLLPMQRITRLPLLVDAVCHRLEPNSLTHVNAKKAMDSLIKVAKRCDDAAKKMQQTEQICMLKSNLEFKVKEFPLISASRFLVKQGELTQIKAEGTGRKSFSKLLSSNKEHVYLFLFNDILLVTKRKGSIFQVRDYCQRNALHVESVDNPEKTHHIAPGTSAGIPNILFLAMLANHENRQVEMIMSCQSESERTRWVDAITPTHTLSEAERIYDCWDCPQFHCVRKYIAQQPDELNLEESDVINVTRKMADGWYEGERIRDGEKGWFPCNHTEEINNSHVRARNLRLRYRLMRVFQEYSQKELLKK